MKSELQIAKENVELFNQELVPQRALSTSITHKQTCQRWLEFLEGLIGLGRKTERLKRDNKIIDLKQAIKFYEDNGI